MLNIKKLTKNKKYQIKVLLIAIAILTLIYIIFAFKKSMIILLLMIASIFVSILVRYLSIKDIGLELVTFGTVLIGYTIGPIPAMFFGGVMILVHMICAVTIGPYLFWVVPAYMIGGLLAALLGGIDFVTLGLIINIFIYAVCTLFTFFTSPGRVPRFLIFVVSNIFINTIIFRMLGPILLPLMQ